MTAGVEFGSGWSFLERAMATAALAALAVAGNAANLPLLFGVDFIFGSVWALVALVWLGPWAGLIAGLAGALYTLPLWGHPYAAPILFLEVAAVAVLVQRGWYLVMATTGYWLVIGAPLALLLYSGPVGLDPTAAGLIALKQSVNGIFNATLAGFILLFLQTLVPNESEARAGSIRLRHLLFTLFMALALLPGLALIAAESWQNRAELERSLAERMAMAAQIMARQPEHNTEPLQGMRVTLLDDRGQPIGAGEPPPNDPGQATTISDMHIHLPERPGLPKMVRWQRGHYHRRVALDGNGAAAAWIQTPAEGVVERLRENQVYELGLLAMLAVGAALGAAFLSRWLTIPLNTLNRLTQGLPERITADAPLPAFPESRIHELQTFSQAIHQMADVLAQSLRTSEAARSVLEERVRARTTDLERRNTELRRLAEVAAHHLQEPARRSMVFAQRLQRRGTDDDPNLRRLEEQIAAMVAIITDLQSYLAYQVRTPEPTTVALDAILAEVRAQLPEEAADLELTKDPDPLPAVPADRALLATLLHQLMSNAVRYRRVEAPLRVQVSAHYQEGAWAIAVADNGRGMEPAYLERVFRLFERLHPDNDPGGSGLGLALARLIVENHGGYIRAESEGLGRGTTIRFTLPDRAPVPGASQPSNGES